MAERAAFVDNQDALDVSRLVFVDESGCHPGIGPRRGWARKGKPLFGPEQSYARGQHVSMIAALSLDGMSAMMLVDGGVKSLQFLRFVRQHLVPTLRPGDVVVWDNINMHKNAAVVSAIENAGASILRLPRYSPDLNPIEAAWAKVKRWIRKKFPQTTAELKSAMRRGIKRITPADALGWAKYCGYPPPLF